jgi:tetratricopeptide (TPR) repeat protein
MDIERIHAERLDEQIELLAHHALQAEVWDKALRYLQQAASKGASRWAFREAARYLELALEVIGRLPNRDELAEQELDVRLALRSALLPLARFNRVAEVLQPTLALAERIGDRPRLGQLQAFHSQLSIELCDSREALASGNSALSIGLEIGDPVLTLTARHQLAGAYFTLGDYRQTIEVGRPAVAVSDEIVVNAVATGAIGVIPYFLVQAQAELGLFADALDDGTILMHRADASGNPLSISMMCVAVGWTHVRRGVPAQ